MHNITYRLAGEHDLELYFLWANDQIVRNNSFSPNPIDYHAHQTWFLNKLKSDKTLLLLFFIENTPVGQVRLDINKNEELEIDYSIDRNWRGKKLAPKLLLSTVKIIKKFYPDKILIGIVDRKNIASLKSFQAAGFSYKDERSLHGKICDVYYYK